MDDHSSGMIVANHLLQPTRKIMQMKHLRSMLLVFFLFGLAPSGVYHAQACCQVGGALLPHLFTLTQ